MATLINAAIPFLAGIYALLVGFRVVGSKPGVNPRYDEFHKRYGNLMKVLGAGCMLLAVFYLMIGSGRH